MRLSLWVAALLVLAITTSSALLRLSQAGVGCTPWPACYAERSTQVGDSDSAPAWHKSVRLVHRVSASAVGLLFVFVVLMGWSDWSGAERTAGALLLGVSAGLAILGYYTPSLLPAVTLANLLGGFALLALLAWLLARLPSRGGERALAASRAAWLFVLLIVVQGASGGLVSARSAAAACFDGCSVASALAAPGATLDLWRSNAALGDASATAPSRQFVLLLHLLLGVASFALAAWVALRRRGVAQRLAWLATVCVVAAATLGLAMLLAPRPLAISVLHSASAALALAFAVAFARCALLRRRAAFSSEPAAVHQPANQ